MYGGTAEGRTVNRLQRNGDMLVLAWVMEAAPSQAICNHCDKGSGFIEVIL